MQRFCTPWNQVPCSGPHWSPTFTWKQGLLWLHPAEGLFSRGWISTQALELESSGGWTSGLTRTMMYLPLKLLISFGCCAPSSSPSLSVSLYLYCSIIWYSCGPCLGAELWGLLAPLPSISKIWSSPRLPKRSSFLPWSRTPRFLQKMVQSMRLHPLKGHQLLSFPQNRFKAGQFSPFLLKAPSLSEDPVLAE